MSASSVADPFSHTIELPPWKNIVSHLAALFIALIFVSSGVWKITDPFTWARGLEEFLVPASFSLPFTFALGIAEAFGGALILIPRFRRWGGVLTSLLLVAFMGWIGLHYSQLLGKDCSCFPIVKRTVGPMFFVGDGAMLAAAMLAAWWAKPTTSMRTAAVILGAITVFASVSFGVAATHRTGAQAPDSITVDGKPYSLQSGKIFVFFYDPTCSHCDAAAKQMSKFHWKDDIAVIAIPTNDPQWAAQFLRDTGMKAMTSLNLAEMKKVFPFGDPPYGVTIERGRQSGVVSHYDQPEPGDTLRKLGYID